MTREITVAWFTAVHHARLALGRTATEVMACMNTRSRSSSRVHVITSDGLVLTRNVSPSVLIAWLAENRSCYSRASCHGSLTQVAAYWDGEIAIYEYATFRRTQLGESSIFTSMGCLLSPNHYPPDSPPTPPPPLHPHP